MEFGLNSAIDSVGRTIWIVDAHRDDGRRFIVHADEKLSAFVLLFCSILHFAYQDETRMTILMLAETSELLCKSVMQLALAILPRRKRMGGDSNPRCLSGTHAFQACTINHSVTHPGIVLVIVLLLVLECNRLRSRARVRLKPTAATVGTIRPAAIECRCKTRRTQRTRRLRDQTAFCKRWL